MKGSCFDERSSIVSCCCGPTANTRNHHPTSAYKLSQRFCERLPQRISVPSSRVCGLPRNASFIRICYLELLGGGTRACVPGRSAYAPPRFLCSPKQPWHAAVCLESLGGRKARHFSNDCRAWRNESLFPENMSSSPPFAKRYQVNQGPKELIL